MNILVVDDDATNRSVLKAILEKEGHCVRVAVDGQQAVDQFDPDAIDMVLMDIMMPIMDGYQATRVIKEKCGERFVPVIFLTAMSVEDALLTCVEHGGDDFLTKPYNRTVLKAKISAMNRIRALYQTVRDQGQQVSRLHEHIMREQEVAEKIFNNIMKRGDADLPMVRALRISADTFNGDIVLAARNPSGGMNVLVGDFTGHGLAAAIGAMPAAEVFYAMTAKGFSIEDIVPEINAKMRHMLPTGRFLSACLLQVDTLCNSLMVWNGGMPDVLVMEPGSSVVAQRIPSERLPLGICDAVSLISEAKRYEITAGTRVFVYSDGVIEATNPESELFGEDRLGDLLTTGGSHEEIAERLQVALDYFRGGQPPADDITFLDLICDPMLMAQIDRQPVRESKKPATCWNAQFEFREDTLRSVDPLPVLMQIIHDMGGFGGSRENLFLVLSELYNNAIDHGVLGLDSKLKGTADGFTLYYVERDRRLRQLESAFVKVVLQHQPESGGGRLSITLEDSGSGFDWAKSEIALLDNSGAMGRGIHLLRQVCSTLEYVGAGNVVQATMHWHE